MRVVRSSLALLFGMLLAGSACGINKAQGSITGGSGNVTGTPPLGTSGSGGAAVTGAAGSGDAGVSSAPAGSGGGGGAGGASLPAAAGGRNGQGSCDPDCVSVPASACTCDSQVPACQVALASSCGGKPCPATLDEALMVANWPLTVAAQDLTLWVHGDYYQWSDGTSSFTLQGIGLYYALFYGTDGRLSFAYMRTMPVTIDGGGTTDDATTARSLCGAPPQSGLQARQSCQMLAEPPPKGSYDRFCQQGGQFNSGPFECEVDANGLWSMPCSDLD